MPFQVFTELPDDSSADKWAFRCLMFYAEPIDPSRGMNPWLMHIAQIHIETQEWRFITIQRSIKEGKLLGIRVVPVLKCKPEGVVAEMKFWLTPFFRVNQVSKEPERVEYTHTALMRQLRDRRIQDYYFSGPNFAQRFVNLVMHSKFIAPDSVLKFISKMDKAYVDYNVPVLGPQPEV
ncbi:hypothetical protein RSOLAG1IB_05822 [Rhizoctonia solani AG-1 IB]|uniref:Uncharacterized protein n=1 Tax=Thanatephorus cucumeris (strain AG1-IB / isolate 7/3/14) TaxID=1108050 RepID=M5BZB8_THACB|nr:hypothetical protein BN14_06027 [Rhizoctonia solani AG-1 IB]CEL52617.1 hypothetical protein RSOLAG1IB_05822 [Rhizoctonia solani AG-1 IB]